MDETVKADFKRTAFTWEEAKELMEALERLELPYVLDAAHSDAWDFHVFLSYPEPPTPLAVLPPDPPFLAAVKNAFKPRGIDNPE